ncbi:hypothetical protein TPHA_0A04950 [Tetrapisispora phaffii CBS 4417]|uniref:Phosphatidylinositol N-acetylglucosaminyltransferase subunit GPI1 n=1 Tax=Tetrapisispora phaffii (strain ATCC 24235 / CBS 4417 / NBRC 1672 / NRRL Y-8282 / UCD 70-5) TaxID=1071381 RepID=G8BNU2_TETPH|nr:hypothetical protein TPHA_0A04950 [Tetrapisispora phaffii CBS 4417]CCE61570.1 hypothetical protein TPHA_0A04950 [Tetrapisispora phaffii CBS 4417]
MSSTIFWPLHLKYEEDNYSTEDVTAVAIQLPETDPVVLKLIPTKLCKDNELKPPYLSVATRLRNCKEWQFIDVQCTIVEFKAPNISMLQFFSIKPILLTLPDRTVDSGCAKLYSNKNIEKICENESLVSTESRLQPTISLLNIYFTQLLAFQKQYPTYNIENKKGYSYNEQNIWNLIKSIMSPIKNTKVDEYMNYIIFYITILIYFIAEKVSIILRWRNFNIVTFSQTFQQIDLKCQQYCYFPIQYLRITKNIAIREALPRVTTESRTSDSLFKDLPTDYYPDYIRFYNTIWLMLNDISFGLILASILYQYKHLISNILHKIFTFYLYDLLKMVTSELSRNPFGIKLNQELSSFLSELFLWIIENSYANFINVIISVKTLEIFIGYCAYISSVFGATFALSLMVDFISILSIHIQLFYLISRKIYFWQYNSINSFWYLFRGKKNNVLRKRIDHHDFELDQLLMGTLLFIILMFLLPTVLAFYISYASFQLVIILVEILIESLISLLNHFPLFALLLRVKDKERIPGGIYFEMEEPSNVLKFKLKSKPLPISMMFKPYAELMNTLSSSYFGSSLVKKLIRGQTIAVNRNKLYQVLYSSLPIQSMSFDDILKKFMYAETINMTSGINSNNPNNVISKNSEISTL